MIGKLTGKIDEIYDDSIILDVNGVGYEIFISTSNIVKLQARINNIATFFIETHVREDHIHLYGFLYREEKSAFNILQTVSGIGAKVALNILSYLTPSQIQLSINTKDKSLFCTVSGVGPKLAERMLVELKGKKFADNIIIDSVNNKTDNNLVEEASSALANLGINKAEAIAIVKNILQNNPNAAIDHVIRIALQNRSK